MLIDQALQFGLTLLESSFHDLLGELLIELVFVVLLLAQGIFDLLQMILHEIQL